MSDKRTFGGNLKKIIMNKYTIGEFVNEFNKKVIDNQYVPLICEESLLRWFCDTSLPCKEVFWEIVKIMQCDKISSYFFEGVDLDDTTHPGLSLGESMGYYRNELSKYGEKAKIDASNDTRTFGDNLHFLISDKFGGPVDIFIKELNKAIDNNNGKYVKKHVGKDDINKWINGCAYPREYYVCQMAEVLDCSCKDFFKGINLSSFFIWGSSSETFEDYMNGCFRIEERAKQEEQKKQKPWTIEDNILKIVRETPNASLIRKFIGLNCCGMHEYIDYIEINKKNGEKNIHLMINDISCPRFLATLAFDLGVYPYDFFDGISIDADMNRLWDEICRELRDLKDAARKMEEKVEKEEAERFVEFCNEPYGALNVGEIDDFINKKQDWTFLKHVNLFNALYVAVINRRYHKVTQKMLDEPRFKEVIANESNKILFGAMKIVLEHPKCVFSLKNFALIISDSAVRDKLEYMCTSRYGIDVRDFHDAVRKNAAHDNVRDMFMIFRAIEAGEDLDAADIDVANAMIKDILER